jgi:hypothetical protein
VIHASYLKYSIRSMNNNAISYAHHREISLAIEIIHQHIPNQKTITH